jgi:hypothetical protein
VGEGEGGGGGVQAPRVLFSRHCGRACAALLSIDERKSVYACARVKRVKRNMGAFSSEACTKPMPRCFGASVLRCFDASVLRCFLPLRRRFL